MLESIVIKQVASYDEMGIVIDNLKRVNFIYGGNATGKTTISDLIANPSFPGFQNCVLNWRHNQPLKTVVYNKHFKEHNFGGSSKIKGIFTLGMATKDDLALIEQKKSQLTALNDELNKQKETLSIQIDKKAEKETEFKETCWTFYKKHEIDFKEAFKGSLHKETFKNKLLSEFKDNTSEILTFDVIIEKSKTILGEMPVSIPFLATISINPISEIEMNDIWKTKIIGKSDVDIAKLIQKLNINDWVNQGRSYLQEDSTCPFCQQSTITNPFRRQIESYFDESFTESINQVRVKHVEYCTQTSNLINLLTQIEDNEKVNKTTKLKIDKYSAFLRTLSSQVRSNRELLGEKLKEPSRIFELISTFDQLTSISNLILEANKEIKKHNDIVNNFQIERSSLIRSIWKFVLEEAKSDILAYSKAISGLQQGITHLDKQIAEKETAYRKLDNEIKDLNRNVTSIQPTIDKINRTLHCYGFHNFEITPSKAEKGYYQIQRDDGTLVESTLSEGEITFITFLYFLQLSTGAITQSDITDDRVLVIDDPVCSLDSNVLFIISALIKPDSVRSGY
jgi:wobble nucleotide-excising tRNase